MKFRIEDDGTSPILLFLEKDINGGMLLMGKMPDGCKFAIMAFHESGTFTRYAGIPADSGFQLTMTNNEGLGQQLVEADTAGQQPSAVNEIHAMAEMVAAAMPYAPRRIQVGDIVNVQPANPMTPAADIPGPGTQPIIDGGDIVLDDYDDEDD